MGEPDFALVEGPWRGRMGPVQSWALGFDAGWRLREVPLAPGGRRFILRPNEWREEWFGSAPLPKSVMIARLRRDLGLGPDVTDDCVEAAGIAGGWAKR